MVRTTPAITRRLVAHGIILSTVAALLVLVGCSKSTDPEEGVLAPTRVQFLSGNFVTVGDTIRVQATAYSKYNGQVDVTWTWKSSATNVATVDATGLIKGVSAGISTITGTATAVGKSASSTLDLTVAAKAVAAKSP